MSTTENEFLLQDLKTQLSSGHAVVVVGAGVSLASTNGQPEASWAGLLKAGARRCTDVVPNLPPGWAERVASEIDSGDIDDLLSAAEKISSKLLSTGGELARWLRDTVGSLRHWREEHAFADRRETGGSF
jgi:hypothetical protein